MDRTISDAALMRRRRLRIGRWLVDPAADEIGTDGRTVKLEPQNMRLLLALAQQPGEVLTIQELLDRVWGDVVVTPNSVYQAVAQIRRQLGDAADEPVYVQTVHRKGYRLVAPVEWIEATESAPAPLAEPRDPSPAPAAPAAPVAPRRGLLIGAGAVLALAGAGAAWRLGRREESPTGAPGAGAARLRLAVLPFVDPSPGGVEQPLAHGIADDVAGVLGRRSDLDVVSADSVHLVGPGALPASAAERLAARVLLLGELRRQGGWLEVQVQLVEPPRAAPVWGQRFTEPEAHAAQLPARIAGEVLTALGLPPLAAAAAPAASAGRPVPTEAYELYVLGRDALRPKTPEAMARAREYFRRGIDADPSFAPNHSALGWTWLGSASTGGGLSLPRAVALATPAFEKALRLDPDHADALAGKAQLHALAGEFEAARRLLEQAIRIQPNLSQAHHTLGVIEFDSGHPLRAIARFERAAALDPLSAAPLDRLALAQTFAGRTEAALATARRTVTLEPRYPNGHWSIGILGYAAGDLVQAVNAYRQALEREPRRPYLWHELGWLYADLGLPEPSAEAFARAAQQLPGLRWPLIQASVAALARAAAGPAAPPVPPPGLSIDGEAVPDDGSAVDLMQLRLLAGLPADAAALQRALDAAAARNEALLPGAWFVFQGLHRLLHLAAVRRALGQPADADLAAVESHLDRLQAQGNRFHALHFHRARVAALRDRPVPALDALEAAVAGGWRRGWWLRLDPALAALRDEPRFGALLSRIAADTERQRRQLGH